MIILFGVSVAIVILIYHYLTKNYNYFSHLGVPFEKPVFLFGNLKDSILGKKHVGIIHTELYRKFSSSPFFGFFSLQYPTLVLRDLNLVKSVMIKDFNSFASTDFVVDPNVEQILMANPFVNTGEAWKTTRGAWSGVMTNAKLKTIYDTTIAKSNIMVSYLKNWVDKKAEVPINARELAVQYLTDNIVTGVLGLECNSFENPNNVYREIATSVFVSDFWEGLTTLLFGIAPIIPSLLKLRFVKKPTEKKLLEITKQIIDAHKSGALKNSLFASAIKENLSEVDIAGRVFGFLTEGIETSSGLTGFTLYELGANPVVQQKLRKELNEAAAANNGVISFEQIHTLPYLHKVVSEVQRLYPAVLKMTRICTSSHRLEASDGSTFDVPEGMLVTVPVHAIHLDEKYYPDPYKFDPERFSEDAIAAREKMTYMPFGEGPRICVGMRLAFTQGKTAIAAIVRNFNIKVSPKTMSRPLPVDPNVMVNRAQGGIWINLSKL